MEERNYWHIQMHLPYGRGEKEVSSESMLKESNPIIGTGEWDDFQCDNFKGHNNGLQIGDIIVVRKGSKIIALCEVISNVFEDADLTEKYGHGLFRNVKVLDWKNEDNNNFSQGTLGRLLYSKRTASWNYINDWYKNIKNMEDLKNITNLLKANKNLILTGAPGTGKTYKTAEIAVSLIDGVDKVPTNRSDLMKRYKELTDAKQIAFTTFHQSLDYEEFIEGLKPDIDEYSGKMTYQVKDGIFKEMCKNAETLEQQHSTQKDEPDSEKSMENEFKEYCKREKSDGKTGDWYSPYIKTLGINIKSIKRHFSDIKDNFFDYSNFAEYKAMYQLITEENDNTVTNILNGGKPNKGVNFSSLSHNYMELKRKENPNRSEHKYAGIPDLGTMMRKLLKFHFDNEKKNLANSKNYILIIDEINRGNISKIFGELITLLEKDKRLGEENEITVTLPYSQETFGVPSNLYIIGTMNTADRSIGHIDYAIRRRFAFKSLKAKENVILNYDKYADGVKEKAKNLFDNIKQFITEKINDDLDVEDLMIGHSYFLCKTEADLKMRLEYEIIPLIEEYEKDGIIMVDKSELKNKKEEWCK